MSRPVHARVTDAVAAKQAALNADVVGEVQRLIEAHDVLVVGMAWNPHVGNARKALTEAGIAHHYHEIGSYAAKWRERLAVKLYTGWPTFPQVFVRGTFVGGNSDLRKALADGTVQALLDAPR